LGISDTTSFFTAGAGEATLATSSFFSTFTVKGLTLGIAFMPSAVKISGISLSSLCTSPTLFSSVMLKVSDQLASVGIPTTSLFVPFLMYIYIEQGAKSPASGCAPLLSNMLYEYSK